jgi:tRNA (guanine-N7-)-methyltransferase
LGTTTATEFWRSVFGRQAPVEIEIGPGTGTFLLAEATRRRDTNFCGVEHSRSRAERLCALVESRGLDNVRVLHAPAQCVVEHLVPQASVSAYHIYFPDPWWKRRHHKRRLFTPAFGRALGRTLVPGGRVYVATDVFFVWALARECCVVHGGLELVTEAAPCRPVRTAFEQKGLRRGATLWEGTFERRRSESSASGKTEEPD